MKVTAAHLMSESSDHYLEVWPGHLTDEQIRAAINIAYGDEAEYIYIEQVERREFT